MTFHCTKMKKIFNFLFLIFLFNLINQSISQEHDCRLINPCKCEFANGTGIDLSPLRVKDYIYADKSLKLSYFFHPCTDTDKLPSTSIKNNDCRSGYSLCRYTNTTVNGTTLEQINNVGMAADARFKVTSKSEAYLIYTKNKIITTISLVCVTIPESYLLIPESTVIGNDNEQQNIILFSPSACIYQLEEFSTLSTGSVLVILFFLVLFIYLGFGILFKLFVMGASGIEVIPNLEFWQDFPLLVRDGAKFLQNGCKVDILTQSNQETYDAI